MTVSRNAALFAAHRTAASLLVDLDRVGYVITSVREDMGHARVGVHLGLGVTARAALAALGLTVVRTRSFPFTDSPFSTADAVYDATLVCVFGDHDPQPGDDPL
jgi:hypothetical protein